MLSGRLAVTLHWMLELLFSLTRVAAVLMSLTRWRDRFVFRLTVILTDHLFL